MTSTEWKALHPEAVERYKQKDRERKYSQYCYKKPENVWRNKVGWPVLQGPFWKVWAKYKAKLGGD